MAVNPLPAPRPRPASPPPAPAVRSAPTAAAAPKLEPVAKPRDPAPVRDIVAEMDIKPVQVAIASAVGLTLAALCFAFIPFGWALLLVLLLVGPATVAGALWGSEPDKKRTAVVEPARAPSKNTANDTLPSTAPVRALQPPKAVAPTAVAVAKEQAPFEKYSSMVKAAGGTLPTEGTPTVLAIRTQAPAAATEYHDTIVVLQADGTATEFTGSTYPGQTRSPNARDANKDGVGDVGIVRPGNYVAHKYGAHYWVKTPDGSGRLPGWRDTDHDGIYSDAERAKSEQRGDIIDEILFHPGLDAERPKSIGCFNLPTNAWSRFKTALDGAKSFSFSLVAAEAA